jgi:hypothetical protein
MSVEIFIPLDQKQTDVAQTLLRSLSLMGLGSLGMRHRMRHGWK